MMQIYTATSLFNFATRIWLRKNSIELNQLKLWAACSVPRADLGLPFRGIIIVIAVLAAAQVPGALWAGSITPIITSVVQEGSIQIPLFTAESKAIWDSEFYSLSGEIRVRYELHKCLTGSPATRVSSCPVPYLQGSILNSGSTATTISNGPRNHSKIDSPS